MSNGPVICSLRTLEIELNDEIRQQLSDHYNNNDHRTEGESITITTNTNTNTNKNTNEGRLGDCDTQRSSSGDRLEGILSAMKRPPAFTTCRVNLIRATREEVLSELKTLLSPISQLEVIEDAGFSDVINIVPTATTTTTTTTTLSNDDPRDRTQNHPRDGNRREPFLSTSTGPSCGEDDTNEDATITSTGDVSVSVSVSTNMFPNWPSRKEKGWSMTHRTIICDRFCGEAVLRGSDIFVKGVLAADTNIRAGEKVAVYADIPRKNDTETVLRGLKLEQYRGRCVYLGLGTTECSRSEIFRKTRGVAVTMSMNPNERVGPPLPPLHGVLSDKMMLQNLPSVLVGHALNPRANDIILDMCSAPGGKTSHLASIVQNRAVIVACDKSKKKVVAAKDFFARIGATCITPLALDATNCCLDDTNHDGVKDVEQIIRDAPVGKEGLKQIKKFHRESFDKILLDPPCSALGLRPKLSIAQESLKELNKHAEYQQKFVRQAVNLLKVGGYMTYSTCTINANENEGMVSHILQEYPCMELLPINLPLSWSESDIGLPGLHGFGLSTEERHSVRRFDPNGVADTMGFFVALFRKRS